ncbi:MAG TPA: MFS transporter [Dehalococcoidia bacterium]|nr:MFS transporter [Dehalococcoidia bacterium]
MTVTQTDRVFGMEATKGRWLFVVFGFLINICLGSAYTWSVFKTSVQQQFKVGAFEGGMPYMFILAFFALFMFFGGRVLEKLGPKKIGIIGGIVVGGGWILSGILPAAIPNIWILVLTFGVIAGAGVGLAYGGPIAVANRWFPDKKGLAVGLTLAGFGGSPFITANIAGPMVKAQGPLSTFFWFGIAFIIITVILSLFLRFPPAGWKPSGWNPAASSTTVAKAELNTSAMTKTATFWGLFLCYTIGCLAGLMAIGIASPVGTESIKLDAGIAAMLVGIFAIFNGAGRPLFGWLTDRITPRWAAVVSLAVICAASLFMLGAAQGTVVLYVICFSALWLCLGGWLAIAPTATTTFFGAKNYAKNYGVVFFAYGIGAILANIISGQSKDLFGTYNIAFIITACLAVIGIILSILLLRPPKTK